MAGDLVMGAAASTSLSAEFKTIQGWKWSHVESVIKAYNEQELPFAINDDNVSMISGLKGAQALQLVRQLSKQPDTGVVNALTVLSAMICMGDKAAGSVDSRIHALYDLVDFDRTSEVSFDELVILFLCFGAALLGILKTSGQSTVTLDDTLCRRLAGQVYQELEMKHNEMLGKTEFHSWVISFLSEVDEINVESVYMSLYHH